MPYTSDRTGAEVDSTLDAADVHIVDTANPHSVTKAQVGLGNVDNTADADKPVSTAQQAALDDKADSDDVLADTNALQADLDALELANTNAHAQILDEAKEEVVMIAASDETTDLTVADGVAKFRMPFAMQLTEVRASLSTAAVGAALTVDVEVDTDDSSGGSIFSTLLTIDAGEKTSTTAATPAVISNPNIPDDSEITINIDQVGSSTAGAGLKLTFKGKRLD